MKILKLIGFVVLFGCILTTDVWAINNQINQIQTQKKTMILSQLEDNDLISTEIKKLGNDKNEVLCLALNMYNEARGSTLDDQISTSYVVFNRFNDKNYPLFYSKEEKSICNIVFDRYQFCWTNADNIPLPKEKHIWDKIQNLAYQLYNDKRHQELATKFEIKHFVVSNMLDSKTKPKWIDRRTVTVQIGKHSYMLLDKKSNNDNSFYIDVIQKAKDLIQ